MTTRHADFKYQMCIIVVSLHFTWLSGRRRTKGTAALIALDLAWHADRDIIRTPLFRMIPPLCGLTLHCAVWFWCSLERQQKRILRPREWKVPVKTGGLHVSVQLLAPFHSGGPFGGICASARLHNSAVPRVCEETLEKVRPDCLKDGSNVT